MPDMVHGWFIPELDKDGLDPYADQITVPVSKINKEAAIGPVSPDIQTLLDSRFAFVDNI